MNTYQPVRRTAGALLIVVPIIFTICFTLLQVQFEYPDILRQPTADILHKFEEGGSELVAIWYMLTLTAVLFLPIVVLVHQVISYEQPNSTLWLATTFGILASIVQTLGFIRWPFLVPHLADIYLSSSSTDTQREAAGVVFEAFHRYAGVAVGEHLGYLATAIWTFLIALALVKSRRRMGFAGMVLAVAIGLGVFEPTGWDFAGTINAIGYLLWAIWLVVFGGNLLVRRPPSETQA